MAVELRSEAVEVHAGEAAATCPFLATVLFEPNFMYPHGLNCKLRRGAARAPSADQLAWFCTNGCHHCCPTYRRSREMGGVS